jgi:hypothetical protein
MSNIRKVLELYENNRRNAALALTKAGGAAEVILNTNGVSEFLYTLAQNNIVLEMSYQGVEIKAVLNEPLKEMTLVEELRDYQQFWIGSARADDVLRDTCGRAADRIEELEAELLNISNGVLRIAEQRIEELENWNAVNYLMNATHDELLAEIKRRMK